MDTRLKFHDINGHTSGVKARIHKPYWDLELHQAWSKLIDLKSKVSKQEFRTKRRSFDRLLRRKERKFNKDKLSELENNLGKNPKKFWNHIKNLGPNKKQKLPKCVEINGHLISDEDSVINHWKNEFENLYQKSNADTSGDIISFANDIAGKINQLEIDSSISINNEINGPISLAETRTAIKNLKLRKATGVDLIKNEIIKTPGIERLVHSMFCNCFTMGMLPSKWKQGIISPIPKGAMTNIYLPMNYRGLMLLSTLEKCYTSILNNRIYNYCESNNIIVDEQGGFRKGYSCQDQIYTLISTINSCFTNKKSCYCAFVDQKKYFDFINCDLLRFRLLASNINGNIYKSIVNLYSRTTVRIKINNQLSKEFVIENGIFQGETLSPLLASLYLNDLVQCINCAKLGVEVSGNMISILLYADDIVLIAPTEEKLQQELDILEKWTNNWQLTCNQNKTKIVHFRSPHVSKTTYAFHLNDEKLEVVSCYKYLGLILDEYLNYLEATQVLSKSGGRALSSIICKMYNYKSANFKTLYTLIESGVNSILTYSSCIWGHDKFEEIEKINKRFIRYFLGLPRNTPTCCLYYLTSINPILCNTFVDKCRFYNRLIGMNDNRLAKKLFTSDLTLKTLGWVTSFEKICNLVGLNITLGEVIPLQSFKNKCDEFFQNKVRQEIYNSVKPVLTKLVCLDNIIPNLLCINNKAYRSLSSKLLAGVLKLEIETGRYYQIERKDRLCKFCNLIESELHFCCICPAYEIPCNLFLQKTKLRLTCDNIVFIVKNYIKDFSSYVHDAWSIRNNNFYKTF